MHRIVPMRVYFVVTPRVSHVVGNCLHTQMHTNLWDPVRIHAHTRTNLRLGQGACSGSLIRDPLCVLLTKVAV